jgi:hypothetical protein
MVPAAVDLVAAVLQGFGIAVTAHEAANPAAAAPPAAAKPSPS